MKIHFIGIGGIGVSALAKYYLEKGREVSGSDLVSSEITDALKEKGAKLLIGKHNAKNVPSDVDLVIYSPAVEKNNPELRQARKFQIFPLRSPYERCPEGTEISQRETDFPPGARLARGGKFQVLSYPEALGELTKQYFTIAVSGTHGKSTTTAMIGLLLIKAGFDPTVIVGTKLKEFGNSNCRAGKSKYLVIEADEWNASFLNYWPKIIVLTNIEREHLDYYKDLNHILKTFKEYVLHLPKDGVLVANRDDENIQRILNSKPPGREADFVTPKDFVQPKADSPKGCIPLILKELQGAKRLVYNLKSSEYPYDRGNIPKIQNSKLENPKTAYYSLKQKGAEVIKKTLKVPGEHNVSNALAALTVARILGIKDEVSLKALSEYKGAWRRFEVVEADLRGIKRETTRKVIIVSDYAHHPTEIRVTLKAAREKWPKKKIWCVFQPHQYQRTFYLFNDFVKTFREAPIDNLIITDIYDVAGREEKTIKEKISSENLIKAIKRKNAIYLKKEKIIDYLKKNLRGGEVVIIMGAGDIYNLTKELGMDATN